jgi:hypothetical protein
MLANLRLVLCPHLHNVGCPTFPHSATNQAQKQQQVPPLRRRIRSGSGRNDRDCLQLRGLFCWRYRRSVQMRLAALGGTAEAAVPTCRLSVRAANSARDDRLYGTLYGHSVNAGRMGWGLAAWVGVVPTCRL